MIQAIMQHSAVHRRVFERGQALVEYALVLAFISVVSIFVMSGMGLEIRGLFLNIIGALHEAGNGF
jgi:Flp pilus assembly pilin Flp